MGRFTKLRRNKKYNYTPRYFDDKGEGNPYKIERKLDRFRSTVETPRGLKAKFGNAMADLRKGADKYYNIRMIIITAILLLIFLYIIDFDLSIFLKN